jgi:penicillin-binding protein 2
MHLNRKNTTKEQQIFQQRIIICTLFIITAGFLLIARLFFLQITMQQHYQTMATENRISIMPTPPERGFIYDIHGIPLAINVRAYRLMIHVTNHTQAQKLIKKIQQLIPISTYELNNFKKTERYSAHFISLPLKQKLTPKEVAILAVNQFKLPNAYIEAYNMRFYPFKNITTPVLGFLANITEQDFKHLVKKEYLANHKMGKAGIEQFYEANLHGQPGYHSIEINAKGKPIRIVDSKPSIPGDDLYLTLDVHLQQAAMHALNHMTGAAVAIDIATGGILALASMPSFNANLMIAGMTQDRYNKLIHNPNKPLFNRATQGLFPPASTIKPFLALAALKSHIIRKETTIQDKGFFQLPNNTHHFRDWNPLGHGIVNVTKAIRESCDTFFYQLAYKMGINKIDEALSAFGFGELTHLDLPLEKKGILASPQWKRGHIHQPWYLGDTIITGIGQGYLLTTPLQLATATMILANNGTGYAPHLLKKIKQPNQKTQELPKSPLKSVILTQGSHWETITHAMQQVVLHGTGFRFGHPTAYTVAAKTGTAQLVSRDTLKAQALHEHTRSLEDHSLFIAFAPINKPTIALAIIVEHQAFAPLVARAILDAYFLKKPHPHDVQEHE